MEAGRAPLVSVVVVSWNSRADLPECLDSLRRQSQPNFEVILVDNGSTDGTAEYVRTEHPWVRLHQLDTNLGYAAGNNAGFARATGEYLVVLNPDTEVEPDFVAGLLEAIDKPGMGLATSRICLFDDRSLINTCGNDIHISGLGFCRGLYEPKVEFEESGVVPSISGCAFMIRRAALDRIGGFDADYFVYAEDSDLSLRAALAGFGIAYAPRSIVYHKYALRMNALKFYYLERNRRLTLLKNLSRRTRAALFPATVATALLMWLYALTHGPAYIAAKWRATRWIWANRRVIQQKRRKARAVRRVSDRDVARLLSSALPADQVIGRGRVGHLLGLPVNAAYWLLAVPLRLFG